MTPDQLKSYRDLLTSTLFNPGRPAFKYPYQRGFNEGVSLAIRKLDELMKEGASGTR